MDCRTARLLLDFHRPRAGELPPKRPWNWSATWPAAPTATPPVAPRTASTITSAPPIRNVPLPDGLRERLLSRLSEQRSTACTGAWPGRRADSPWPPLCSSARCCGGTSLPRSCRSSTWPSSPAWMAEKHKLRSSESVTAWFHDRHHVSMIAPPFDYDWLIECDMVDVQGKRFRDSSSTMTGAGFHSCAGNSVCSAARTIRSQRPARLGRHSG